MSRGLFDSLTGYFESFWTFLQATGPAANFASLISLLTLTAGVVRWYVHRRLKTQDWRIHLLEKNLAETEEARAAEQARKTETEARCAAAESHLAEAGLAESEKEWADHNYERANRALAAWCQREGPAISKIMLHRSEWAEAHAIAEQRPSGIVAAESYAIAALSLWPQNRDAITLLNDIENTMQEEAQPWPTYKKALLEFQEYAFQPFNRDLADDANAVETQAFAQFVKGRYHSALPLAERAIHLRLQTVGRTALQTYRALVVKTRILEGLGRYEEALPIIRAVVAAEETSEALGPAHPETLHSRHLEAQVLDDLGRYEEALLKIRAVVAAEEVSEALGPVHPKTLVSRHLEAQILYRLGCSEEALPKIRAVVAAEETSEALGTAHPETLFSRHLEAYILDGLGCSEEALPIIRAVVAVEEASAALGPAHPRTLYARYLEAKVLDHLGRCEEALPIIRAVVAVEETSAALGTAHPETLHARHLETQILDHLNPKFHVPNQPT